MSQKVRIIVRYTQGTWVARAKGYKQTASCVYDTFLAAKSLARKLGLDEHTLLFDVRSNERLEYIAMRQARIEHCGQGADCSAPQTN